MTSFPEKIVMADTELTVQADGRHWTDIQADGRHWTDSTYFHRIPFGFIFPLSVVWCCFANYLSQFAVTRVLLCCVQFVYVFCTVRQWASGLPFAAYKSGDEWNAVCWICVGLVDWASDAGYWICCMCVQPLACLACWSGSEPSIALPRKSISTADNTRSTRHQSEAAISSLSHVAHP